jgi:transposase
MKKISKSEHAVNVSAQPERTVGLDLGDRYSHYCIVTGRGECMEEGRIQSTEAALRKQFGNQDPLRIALEAGTHSPWVSQLLEQLGHQVIVANTRKIPVITSSKSKNDRNDARDLARFAAFDPELLSPIQHRGRERQQDLNLLRTRSVLVRARTMLVNALRGLVKNTGQRLPTCSTESFPVKARAAVPAELKLACDPLIDQVKQLNLSIRELDKQVVQLDKKYPEIAILRTVPGVGPVVAACYVLTLDSPHRIHDHRQAGAYLGLRPSQSQSGDSNPQENISRTGKTYLRSLLVQSAQYILGRFGPDSALRRWGLKLAASGGKRGKKRAIVAVARKLAVMLHSMWRNRKPFQPFPEPVAKAA